MSTTLWEKPYVKILMGISWIMIGFFVTVGEGRNNFSIIPTIGFCLGSVFILMGLRFNFFAISGLVIFWAFAIAYFNAQASDIFGIDVRTSSGQLSSSYYFMNRLWYGSIFAALATLIVGIIGLNLRKYRNSATLPQKSSVLVAPLSHPTVERKLENPSQTVDVMERLKESKKLLDQGLIDEDDFKEMKNQILKE